jgi:hypothetical protein
MLFSRVGLSSIVLIGILSLSSYANADGFMDGYGYMGGHNGVYIRPVPVKAHCGSWGWHKHHGHHMAMEHRRPMHRAFYVCTKYTYEITPIHRDIACSHWKFSWMHQKPYKD